MWSNAGLEDVGGRQRRTHFFRVLMRVFPTLFLAVSYRWVPVAHHTWTPPFHWDTKILRLYLRSTRLGYWTDPSNMDFVSKKVLLEECPAAQAIEVFYTGLRLGPFSSNLALIARGS